MASDNGFDEHDFDFVAMDDFGSDTQTLPDEDEYTALRNGESDTGDEAIHVTETSDEENDADADADADGYDNGFVEDIEVTRPAHEVHFDDPENDGVDNADNIHASQHATSSGNASTSLPIVQPDDSVLDFKCPVCHDLLYKPVRCRMFPCSYRQCLACLDAASRISDTQCGSCKVKQSIRNSTVDNDYADIIKARFPAEYEMRANGGDASHIFDTNVRGGPISSNEAPIDARSQLFHTDAVLAKLLHDQECMEALDKREKEALPNKAILHQMHRQWTQEDREKERQDEEATLKYIAELQAQEENSRSNSNSNNNTTNTTTTDDNNNYYYDDDDYRRKHEQERKDAVYARKLTKKLEIEAAIAREKEVQKQTDMARAYLVKRTQDKESLAARYDKNNNSTTTTTTSSTTARSHNNNNYNNNRARITDNDRSRNDPCHRQSKNNGKKRRLSSPRNNNNNNDNDTYNNNNNSTTTTTASSYSSSSPTKKQRQGSARGSQPSTGGVKQKSSSSVVSKKGRKSKAKVEAEKSRSKNEKKKARRVLVIQLQIVLADGGGITEQHSAEGLALKLEVALARKNKRGEDYKRAMTSIIRNLRRNGNLRKRVISGAISVPELVESDPSQLDPATAKERQRLVEEYTRTQLETEPSTLRLVTRNSNDEDRAAPSLDVLESAWLLAEHTRMGADRNARTPWIATTMTTTTTTTTSSTPSASPSPTPSSTPTPT